VARKFALYGTRCLDLDNLDAEVRRRGLIAHTDGVVLQARQVLPKQIICAPCLQGHDYEDEYIIDPRKVTITEYRPASG
jgi:hypothetical protein